MMAWRSRENSWRSCYLDEITRVLVIPWFESSLAEFIMFDHGNNSWCPRWKKSIRVDKEAKWLSSQFFFNFIFLLPGIMKQLSQCQRSPHPPESMWEINGCEFKSGGGDRGNESWSHPLLLSIHLAGGSFRFLCFTWIPLNIFDEGLFRAIIIINNMIFIRQLLKHILFHDMIRYCFF